LSPTEDIGDDFVAYQRELSRSLLSGANSEEELVIIILYYVVVRLLESPLLPKATSLTKRTREGHSHQRPPLLSSQISEVYN